MINSVEGCGKVKEAESGDLLVSDGGKKFIMKIGKNCFCGVMLSVGGLMGIEQRVG